ncbi:hypothetical protein ACSS6W_007858 [Trichoderma asperelloides]
MASLILSALIRLSFSQDSREEIQSESSVIKIRIDPIGLAEDVISVESPKQSKNRFLRITERFIPKEMLKSSPDLVETSATGFRAATRQWRDANSKPKELAELAGRSSLLWSRTVKRLQIDDDLDGGLGALIVCEAYTTNAIATKINVNPLSSFATAERFLSEFRQLGDIYRPQRTRRNLGQLFLLQLHHANLNLYSDFLQSFTMDYAAPRMFMYDPREVELRRWNLKAIMTDSHLYRQLTSLGAELTATTESLLDVLLALDDGIGENSTRLAVLGAEIRGCSKDIMTRLSRISGDLDHNLQLLRLSKEMSQSSNVQMLTLLATIFLPLSLAAGVLSMQSRFKDLGDLLYDFFGVVVLLAAAVALLVVIMLLLSSAKELESRLFKYHWYKAILRPALLATIFGITLTLGALVLTSFVVGMFKDVVLGAKILGYGIASAIGALVVIPYTVFMVFWLPTLWEFGGTKKKQSDLEGEPKGKDPVVGGPKDAGVKIQAQPSGSNSQDASSTAPTARAVNQSPEDTSR